ncbi:MAG: universal stress protein [Cyclobacteriaceae bacterium]|nr:universal stress protein [Cyclobacteriaceae bacterium]MDH4298200.1 universal stress protein [Cyclobacteriaceae bacterium]
MYSGFFILYNLGDVNHFLCSKQSVNSIIECYILSTEDKGMQKILVPCDFSEQAISAFRFALDLARQSNREVHLLHVIELPVMHDSMLMPTLSFEATLLKELRENAEEQFTRIKEKYAADTFLVSKVTFGYTSMMILDYIEEVGIEFVVMGTKGVSGLRELLIGSNAEKIVRRAACPVITVRKDSEFHTIKSIVFPNSLEENQEDLVSHVKALQDFFHATLHVVWINTPGNFTSDSITMIRLEDFARRFKLKDYTLNIFNDAYEESGVMNFAHKLKADLIAMGTHGRKGLNHVLSGSVAEDVVNHIDCPIWTYSIKKVNG